MSDESTDTIVITGRLIGVGSLCQMKELPRAVFEISCNYTDEEGYGNDFEGKASIDMPEELLRKLHPHLDRCFSIIITRSETYTVIDQDEGATEGGPPHDAATATGMYDRDDG